MVYSRGRLVYVADLGQIMLAKLTPEMREKALIFMQGMAAMVQPAKSEKKEQTA